MPEFQIERGDETITVDTDELTQDALPSNFSLNGPGSPADGYVTEAVASHRVEQAQAEAGGGDGMTAEEAAQDDDVVQAVLAEHGDGDVDLDAHRSQWEEENLSPLRDERDALQSQVLSSALMAAAREHGVREEFVEGGADSYLAHLLSGRLEHDADHGVVALGSEGERLPGSDGNAFASPGDLLGRMQDSGDHDRLFSGETPQGGGGSRSSGSGGSSGGGIKSYTQDQIDKVTQRALTGDEDAIEELSEIDKAMSEGRVS